MSLKNPFGDPEPASVACPVCKKSDFDARQNQYETWRECRKCGNRWSGGSVGAKQPDFSLAENLSMIPPPGVAAPDDDLPVFYDPGKNFGFEGDD